MKIFSRLLWPVNFSFTVAHKCTPNSNSRHQIQIAHTELKFTTLTSNRSHRIQIHHDTKFQLLSPNSNSPHQIQIAHTEFQIHHTKFKLLTPIQIHHTEFKFATPNSNSPNQIVIQILPDYFKNFDRELIICNQTRIFNCDQWRTGQPAPLKGWRGGPPFR